MNIQRSLMLISVVILVGPLAACGSDKAGANQGAAQTAAHPTADTSGNASALQVAAQARGKVTCPTDVPAAAAGSPVDDVVGVRPGLTYEQAANVVMCSNPLLVVTTERGRGYNIKTYGQTVRQGFEARFAEPRVQMSGRDYARQMERDAMARSMNAVRSDMKPGQTKWFVSTMGMPGQEKVISAAREQWFENGRNPTMASVEQSLVKKYGAPTRRLDNGDIALKWVRDARGRPVTETSPLFSQCGVSADPDSGTSLSPNCGIAVAATIRPLKSNPALAKFLQAAVVDSAGGYQALTATEQGLQGMDAKRRAQEVKQAADSAQAPQL